MSLVEKIDRYRSSSRLPHDISSVDSLSVVISTLSRASSVSLCYSIREASSMATGCSSHSNVLG